MSFQSTVNIQQGFGVPGEVILASPNRTESLVIDSSGNTPNVYGYAATKSNSTNVASMGGTVASGVVFAGLMIRPKEAQLQGTTAGGTLAPTLEIPDNSEAEFCTMGDVVVSVNNAANIGDELTYSTTTGELKAMAPGGTPASGYAAVPNAVVYRYPVTSSSGGLTVARLTN